jgi:integrase/recombinase XerD
MNMLAERLIELGIRKNPTQWTKEDVLKFLKWLDEVKLDNSTKRKYFRYIQAFMDYYDNENNSIITRMIKKGECRKPRVKQKPVRTISTQDIQLIQQAAQTIEGWNGSVARLITKMYYYTGLRPSELRKIEFRDVNTREWSLVVSHPKAEETYGEPRKLEIMSELNDTILDFIDERRDYLITHGFSETAIPFIPYLTRDKQITFWPHQKFLRLKAELEKRSGVAFKLKDYRSTFCTDIVDENPDNLLAVSRYMGHGSVKTTQTYYLQMKWKHDGARIQKAFQRSMLSAYTNQFVE